MLFYFDADMISLGNKSLIVSICNGNSYNCLLKFTQTLIFKLKRKNKVNSILIIKRSQSNDSKRESFQPHRSDI